MASLYRGSPPESEHTKADSKESATNDFSRYYPGRKPDLIIVTTVEYRYKTIAGGRD